MVKRLGQYQGQATSALIDSNIDRGNYYGSIDLSDQSYPKSFIINNEKIDNRFDIGLATCLCFTQSMIGPLLAIVSIIEF